MAEALSNTHQILQMDALTSVLRQHIVDVNDNSSLIGPSDFLRDALSVLQQIQAGNFPLNSEHHQVLRGLDQEERFSLEQRLPAIAEAIFGNETFAKGVALYLQQYLILAQNQRTLPAAVRRLMTAR